MKNENKNKHQNKKLNKLDARYQKSESKIKVALCHLLEIHSSHLSTKDICRLANIKPSTFYRHYRNPEHALVSLEKNLNQEFQNLILKIPENQLCPHKITALIFLFVYQNRFYFSTANHRHNYQVLDLIITQAYRNITKQQFTTELSLTTYHGAIIYLIDYWGKATNFDLAKSSRFIKHILSLPKILDL